MITKYKQGSLKELWVISFPLMLSSFSITLMLFVDRLLLARYSTEALNAAVNASTMAWVFSISWLVMTTIAEVFVAQYNGAKQLEKIGKPIWQMIWLSLFSLLFFLPLFFWGSYWFFGASPQTSMHRQYFKWLMLFGPIFPLWGALSSFYIGRGKTLWISILTLAANGVNGFADYVLIFGIDGVIPSMGVKGAAIATSLSSLFQVLIVGWLFLSKKNHILFRTRDYHFNTSMFMKCLKVGAPNAIFIAVEILGWALYYQMMTKASFRHITVAGIGQSFLLLFYFFGEGVSKGVATVIGNMIGAKKGYLIPKTILAGIKMHLLFFSFLSLGYFLFFQDFLSFFMNTPYHEIALEIRQSLEICVPLMIAYLFFEGLRLLFNGVLLASGDTFFLLVSGVISIWVLLVFPVYYFVVIKKASVELASFISVFYCVIVALITFLRYSFGTWKRLSLVT